MLYNNKFWNTSTELNTNCKCIYSWYLRDKESVQVDLIINETNNYFINSFSSEFYKQKINYLIQNKKLNMSVKRRY
ncbi:hypothetical protein MASR1M31_13030 [Porphyromonadaceae bacterium]